MDLRKKILSGYFIIIALLIAVSFVGYQTSKDMMTEFNRLNEEVIPKLGLVDQIKSGVSGQANDERGFLLTGDDQYAKEIIEKAEKTKQILEKSTVKLDEKDKKILHRIDAVYDEFTQINKQVIAAYKSGNIGEAKRLSFEEGRKKRKELDPLYIEFNEAVSNDLKEAQKRLVDEFNRNIYITIGVVLGAVTVALFFGFYIAYKIVTPIKAIVENSKLIAEGDFSINKIVVNTRDESRDLADSFNTMVQNVKTMVKQVSVSTEQVALNSNQLSSNVNQASLAVQQVAVAIQEVAKGASDQTSFVNNTFETVGQVNCAIQQISAGAGEQAIASELQRKWFPRWLSPSKM